MLSNILPGLREFRTPLAVGWTWLFALWIALRHLLPPRDSPVSLVRDVLGITTLLGQATVLGVLTFVAYLLGSLLEKENVESSIMDLPIKFTYAVRSAIRTEVSPLQPSIRNPRGRDLAPLTEKDRQASEETAVDDRNVFLGAWMPIDRGLDYAALSELGAFIRSHGVSLMARRSAAANPSVATLLKEALGLQSAQAAGGLVEQAARRVLSERTQLETRLLAEKNEVYDYYNRLKESANFRTNLAFAVLALGAAAAGRLYFEGLAPWIYWAATLAGILVCIALVLRGRSQFHRSRLALVNAVTTGLIKSPALQVWENAAEQQIARETKS
jgi:hypothetical protein